MASRRVLALVLGLVGARGAQLRSVAQPASALQLHEGAWVPEDLAVVDHAIRNLLTLKLSAEKHQAVQKAADKVHQDLAGVTSGKKLSRAERRAKVEAALKEIQGLAEVLAPAAAAVDSKNLTSIKQRMAELKQELAEKTTKLAEEQKELKLDAMKKELAEKKQELQHLREKGEAAPAKRAAAAADVEAAQAAPAAGKPAALEAVLATLQKRAADLKADLGKLDAGEKKSLAALDVPHLDKDDVLAKGQALLESLKRDESRKFEKARVLKKAELAELSSAIDNINKGDVKALSTVLAKMQRETKTLDARSGHFLH